jgi:hypothetical protein
MRLVCSVSGEDECVLTRPSVCSSEGQPSVVELSVRAPHADKAPAASNEKSPRPTVVAPEDLIHCRLETQVTPADEGRVHLMLALEYLDGEKTTDEGTVSTGKTLQATQTIPAGKAHKMVLDSDAKGNPQHWIEVTVREVDRPRPAVTCAPPPACEQDTIGSCLDDVCGAVCDCAFACLELCAAFLDLDGCPFAQTCEAGMTLPSPRYLEHPPQYFAPSPPFPLPRELAAQEARVCLPPPTPCSPSPSTWASGPTLTSCAAVEAARSSSGTSVHAVIEDGRCRLRMDGNDCCATLTSVTLKYPGCREIHLAAVRERVLLTANGLKASADTMRLEGTERIVLQGAVRLDSDDLRVRAEKVIIGLKDDHVEVCPSK